ncbi:MAG: hypothetical protein WC460_00860 [Patescibacteria group bacterium]
MSEKKFGETPIDAKNIIEAIFAEKKKEGFIYATDESLTGFVKQDDGTFKEMQTQSLEDIKARYRKIDGVKDVSLVRISGDNNLIWVFLKY